MSASGAPQHPPQQPSPQAALPPLPTLSTPLMPPPVHIRPSSEASDSSTIGRPSSDISETIAELSSEPSELADTSAITPVPAAASAAITPTTNTAAAAKIPARTWKAIRRSASTSSITRRTHFGRTAAAATPSPASPASPASSETDDESQLSSGITEPATGPRRSRKDRRAGRRNRADSKASAGEGGIFTLPNLSLSNFMRWNDQNAKPSYLGVHGNHELYDLKRDFMLDLTRAMTEYGLPTHRLEYHLETVGECLGIQSSFTVLPGVILMSFTAEKRTSETFFLKSKQGYNMGKLLLVSELCNSVVRGMMTTQQARTSLADIRAIKTAPLWTALITYPFVSFGFCSLIIGGTWGDSIIAAIVSLPVAALTMTGVKVPGIRYLLDFLSAFSATLLGNCLRVPLQSYFGCMTSLKIVLGAVAVPLPGLALTNGIIELSTHNVISGTVHILNAIFTALLLGFGYTIGDNLTQLLPLDVQAATCPTHPISPIWSILILPAMAFGFNVLVHPSPKQHAIMMFTQALGYTITTVLPMFTIFQNSVEPVTIIAAFSIGLTANLYARFTRDVAIAPIIGGILPLVPGSMGFRTFAVRDGSGIAMQMLTISVCLTIGLLMASLLVWPIRGPRLKYLTV